MVRNRRSLLLRWVLPIIIVALIIIGRLFFFVYVQPTASSQGSSILLMSRTRTPHRGDCVLLSLSASDIERLGLPPEAETHDLSSSLLRVIGEPGDTLLFDHNKLTITGRQGVQTLPMILPQALQQDAYEVILAPDEYWLLAGQELAPWAIDSRHLGPIHRSLISATVVW